MKRSPALQIALAVGTVLIVALISARGHVTQAAGNQYRLVEDWAQLPPGQQFGGVSGVDIDPKGVLYAFRRDAGNIWTLDPTGKFVREWGPGIAKRTHSIRVDRDGFIWTTDSAGHTVKKFRADGTLVMTLGKYDVAGDGPDTFNQPTDVCVTVNGDFFVTDGYGNSRVVKFNKEGTYIKEWGTKGTGPGQFNLPHAIVQDSRGRLIVADRTNKRLQVFDTDGKFLEQWTHLGVPYGLYITKSDMLVVGDFESAKIFIADARTAKLLDTIDGTPNVHAVAVDPAGNIYAASNSKFYLKKFIRTPKSD